MWNASGYNLEMAEGDYGVELPISVAGVTLGEHDSLRLAVKDAMNGQTILTREFTGITDNTVRLELTAAESALLPVGGYVWLLDWYQNGSFLCNLIPVAAFKVVDKA